MRYVFSLFYVTLILTITESSLAQTSFDSSQTESPSEFSYSIYYNARFDYCIQYPDQVLFPQPESMNGAGREFKNKKGKVVLTVWGQINQNNDGNPVPIQQQYQDDLKEFKQKAVSGDTITYKKLGKIFYVLSGIKAGKIFYHKIITKGGAFCFAEIDYSPADKEVYNNISNTIFNSFR